MGLNAEYHYNPDEIQICLNCKKKRCNNCLEGKTMHSAPRRWITVRQIDLATGEVIAEYPSAASAAAAVGIKPDAILRCVSKKRQTAGGYRWEGVSRDNG